MRADRLIAILLMLQRRGRLSAAAMAQELEVSRRTVMRDLEALGAAGVPVYSVRGPGGGYALWEGFRTQITGLTANEVRSLPLLGLPEHAELFGLSDARIRTRHKVAMNLPTQMESELDWIDQRFLYDPERMGGPGRGPFLLDLARAIEGHRVVAIGDDGVAVYPLGLIDNAGIWYLVADVSGKRRVLPVASLGSVRTTNRRFHRPGDVDLRGEWERFRIAQSDEGS